MCPSQNKENNEPNFPDLHSIQFRTPYGIIHQNKLMLLGYASERPEQPLGKKYFSVHKTNLDSSFGIFNNIENLAAKNDCIILCEWRRKLTVFRWIYIDVTI